MRRSQAQQVEEMERTIAEGAAFQQRVKDAAGHADALADLMADAIAMDRTARSTSAVDRNGKSTVTMQRLQACYCLDAAREAYLAAKANSGDRRAE